MSSYDDKPNDTWKIPYLLHQQKKEIVRFQYIRDDANIDPQGNENTIQVLYKTLKLKINSLINYYTTQEHR